MKRRRGLGRGKGFSRGPGKKKRKGATVGRIRAALTRKARIRSKPQPTTGYRLWIRGHPCEVPGCRARERDPHHVQAKGMGRRDPHVVDEANVCSLCRYHHQLGDSPGWSWVRFEEAFHVDLQTAALLHWARWRDLPQEERDRWEDQAVAINRERGVKYRRAA